MFCLIVEIFPLCVNNVILISYFDFKLNEQLILILGVYILALIMIK